MSDYDFILEQIQSQLETLAVSKQLIVLHPAAFPIHGQVILPLLEKAEAVAWVPLSAGQSSYAGFLDILPSELEKQIQQSLSFSHLSSPDETCVYLAEFLCQFTSFLLVLENYDYVLDTELDGWLLRLVSLLPSSHRLLIGGRGFRTDFLRHIPQEMGIVLPHLPSHLMVNYFHPPENLKRLEVCALGTSQATIVGRLVKSWEGTLPKSLFYFLVDRGMTTRSLIFENFWPDLQKKEATNVFHVTKRKVNEMIQYDLMRYDRGYYWLDNQVTLQYDVVLFQEAVQQAEVADTPQQAFAFYEQALRLYRGHFLTDLDHAWVLERREELQHVYSDALMGLGSLCWQDGDLVRAEALLLRAALNLPQREDAAETALQFCWQNGKKDMGLALFKTLQASVQSSAAIGDLVEKLHRL